MKRTSRNGIALLSALALTAAPVALAATAASLGLAEAAHAKPGNGNGGGNGGGNGNRGGNSAAAKDKADARQGGGRDGGGGHPDAGQRGVQRGGGGLFEALGLKKRTVVVRAAPQGETRRAPKPVVTASPVPRAKPDIADADAGTGEAELAQGNSWKTRLDGGLTTHPSELGPWNSARRSPVAIANMAEKYRMTGDASGAGGMIGALVVAYEDYASATTGFQTALDEAIAAELIDEATANRLIDGTLTEDAILTTVMEFEAETGALFVEDEATGTYSCDDSGGGDCALVGAEDLDALNADAAALSLIESDAASDDYSEPALSIEEANAMVQPQKSTDPAVQEAMLADVLGLLGLEEADLSLYEVPEESGEELLPEDGLEPVDG